MTPELHHKGDTRWLTEQFDVLVMSAGIDYAKTVAEKYSSKYKEIQGSIEESHKRDGKARYECNTRLRSVINNLNQKFVEPPTI